MKIFPCVPPARFPFPSLTSFAVDRHPSHRPADPLHRLPCPLPRRRMCDCARARPPAVSLARKSARPSWAEQLFRLGVQFLGHVFHSAVVPDGTTGQRVHCGYISSLPWDWPALTTTVSVARRSAFASG